MSHYTVRVIMMKITHTTLGVDYWRIYLLWDTSGELHPGKQLTSFIVQSN